MDDLLQIKETVIDAGLKKEYKFFQISDMHMSYIDNDSSQTDIKEKERSIRQWTDMKREYAERFGEFCDERYDIEASSIFESLTDFALRAGSDALIFSGDIIDRVTESSLRYMRNFIKNYPIPVIYCPGNHAWTDEYGNFRNMYSRFSDVIKNPAFDVYDFGEFEIVTVDNGRKEITEYQLERMRAEIESGKKIVLVLHAPLNLYEFGAETGKILDPYFLMGSEGDSENAFEFVRLVKENDSHFICALAGHIHAAQEYKITPNLMQITTSSGLIGAGRQIIIK